jgi:hypothetical protein
VAGRQMQRAKYAGDCHIDFENVLAAKLLIDDG